MKSASLLATLGGLLVVMTLVASATGSVSISFVEIAALVARRLGFAPSTVATDGQASVLFAIRLPRVVLGVLVGGGLGISGASLQGIFRNPLVDPGLLGVSTGAALGAVVTIVLGASIAHGIPSSVAAYALPIAAFAGALASMTAVQRIALVGKRTTVATLLLAGIAVNALAGAAIGFLTYVANDAQLRTITFWSFGSLGGATWKTTGAVAAFCGLPMLLLARFDRALNTLLLGEAEAAHLGFDVERTKRVVVFLVAMVVGASVAIAGVVGFVGLVVPHLLRLIGGPDHRFLLPASALLGGSLVVGSDVLARSVVAPAELPLGIVTAGLGTPFFLALLLRERTRLA